ncbi:hypothetical protein BCR36DRAFT_405394 [Piromyces finnis]|uniref:W2 domain-containing protein n=1 Tax=Piromyces finnis TaxID=1754191 RepID=A0A1Y1V4Q4_9FUNG|nr:hypothetical protein BCR36DRAFT_405394 [Piromyces finnis]|eukprot:ORX47328.1 hypothetical protein BCR36DRAFT_405394 [Piromyces finnis]
MFVVNKLSNILNMIKPEPKSPNTITIKTTDTTNGNSGSGATTPQNKRHSSTRRNLHNFEYKSNDLLEPNNKKHSPTSSISSLYSYNSETSLADKNFSPKIKNINNSANDLTKNTFVNIKKEIVSTIVNPINFVNHILDSVYDSITIFIRYRELQKNYMSAQSQISELKLHNKYLDSHLKSVKRKRDTFNELIKELKNEIQRERQARFMVEKCHSEKVERLLFEDDMKEREIDDLKNKNRELERKLCKIKEDLNHYKEKLKAKNDYIRKKYNNSPTQQLYNNLNSTYKYDSDSRSVNFNEDSDYEAYSSPSLCNIDFEADSKSDDFTIDSSIKSATSDYDSDSDNNEDNNISGNNTNTTYEIPKDSPYYELFNKPEEKESAEEDLEYEEDKDKYVEINFFNETTDEITHKLISDSNPNSILVDVYEKMVDRYPQALPKDWIYVTLKSFLRFFELKNMISNNQFIQAAFKKYKKLLLRCIETPDDQLDLLNALEVLCIKNPQRLRQHLRFLMTLYEVELVDPYIIIRWYNSKNTFDFTNKMDYKPVESKSKLEKEGILDTKSSTEASNASKNIFIKRHRSRSSVSSTSQDFAKALNKMEELRELDKTFVLWIMKSDEDSDDEEDDEMDENSDTEDSDEYHNMTDELGRKYGESHAKDEEEDGEYDDDDDNSIVIMRSHSLRKSRSQTIYETKKKIEEEEENINLNKINKVTKITKKVTINENLNSKCEESSEEEEEEEKEDSNSTSNIIFMNDDIEIENDDKSDSSVYNTSDEEESEEESTTSEEEESDDDDDDDDNNDDDDDSTSEEETDDNVEDKKE